EIQISRLRLLQSKQYLSLKNILKMFRFVVASMLLASVVSANYDLGRSYGSTAYTRQAGLTGMSSGLNAGNYGGYASSLMANYQPLQLSGQKLTAYDYSSGPLVAAVQTRHSIQTYDVPSTLSAPQALNIEVPSSAPTMNFLMKSRSSNINVESVHEGATGSFKETSSVDEPYYNRHTVQRPVVQEVREIVTPFRKVVQEVQPVQEEVETILPRGQYQEYQQQLGLAQAAPVAAVAQPAQSSMTLLQPSTSLVQPAPTLSQGGYGSASFSGTGLSSLDKLSGYPKAY
ncbi:hypothetical protein SSS_06070, partial [Sarcoptes scabiei]